MPKSSNQPGIVTKITPRTALQQISPIPGPSKAAKDCVRKTGRRLAEVLTTKTYINKKIAKHKIKKEKTNKPRQKAKKRKYSSESSEEDIEKISLRDESDGSEDFQLDNCVGCGEEYSKTKKRNEWIRCRMCRRWFHDCCSNFIEKCNECGKLTNA